MARMGSPEVAGLPADAWLDKWAAERADAHYLVERDQSGGWREVTWSEAASISRSIAQALIDRGLGAQSPVAVLSGNSVNHGLLMLGAMRAGVVPVQLAALAPIPADYTQEGAPLPRSVRAYVTRPCAPGKPDDG